MHFFEPIVRPRQREWVMIRSLCLRQPCWYFGDPAHNYTAPYLPFQLEDGCWVEKPHQNIS